MTSEVRRAPAIAGPGPGSSLSTWGVVLLGHGSQRGTDRSECSCSWKHSEVPEWCQQCPSTPQGLNEAATRLQALLGLQSSQVVLSCLEFIQPFPEQAIGLLKDRGFRRVAVMPFLLGHGKHATLELDEMLTELRVQSPQVQIYLAEGLGADPQLADLVVQRVLGMRGLLPSPNGGDRTAGILLVKAGTQTQYDDCLWLEELGRLVEKRLGPGYAVAAAQSHYGDPTMESAARYLVEERHASTVLCVPYLFFPGLILKRNVLGGMDQLRQKYPDVPMAVAPPLGVDDRVITVAAERVRELWERAETNGP